MKVTLDWVKNKFGLFNQKYFNGELPIPEFKLENNSSSTLGYFSLPGAKYNKSDGRIFKIENNGVLGINTYYDRDEKSFIETLLHEMIHEYIYVVDRVVPKNLHGEMFQELASKMISDGYNISETNEITRKTEAEPQNTATPQSILCVIYKPQGENYKYWFCKAGDNEIQRYKDRAISINGVSDVKFFICNSVGFSTFKSDLNTLNGFGGFTAYDVQQEMARYFGEDPSLFDIQNLKQIK